MTFSPKQGRQPSGFEQFNEALLKGVLCIQDLCKDLNT